MNILTPEMNTMINKMSCCVIVTLCLVITESSGQSFIKKYDVTELAKGVYSFTWRDPSKNPVESNSLFVINENDVIVVDPGWWPSATQIMIDELKKLTNKPVRYVLNTHWHGDHVNGNFLYRKYWPEVEIVAHDDTRKEMKEQIVDQSASILQQYKDGPAEYVKWLKEGKDPSGKVLDSARRKRIQQVVNFYDEMIAEFNKVKFVLPDHIIADSLILYRGDRIIKFLWLGRGNTTGDMVLFRPKEKIVATGDLVVDPIPFGFGSYYKEWIHVLSHLEHLGANVYMPGHGSLKYDSAYIRQIKDMLSDLVAKVDEAVKEGLSLEDTQKRVTLDGWKKKFAGDDMTKQQSFDSFFLAPAIEGAWRQARGEQGAK